MGMIVYQQTRLSDLSAIGAPGSIPYCVANWHDAELADLDAMRLDPQFGLGGMGFWPVIVSAATFDPAKQVATSDIAGLTADVQNRRWTAIQVVRDLTAAEIAAMAPAVPDGPTLSDWRVALTLWGRLDDVSSKVADLITSSNPAVVMIGKIAKERLEYANNVLRAQLLQLKDALGFTAADVDESLWRAHQVSVGDLSGKWPL